jgi:hypothetical protein
MKLWVLLGLLTSARAQCAVDEAATAHRLCAFTSDAVFKYSLTYVMQLSGCNLACLSTCDCTCGLSGPVHTALTAHVPAYCMNNPICKDPVRCIALIYSWYRLIR